VLPLLFIVPALFFFFQLLQSKSGGGNGWGSSPTRPGISIYTQLPVKQQHKYSRSFADWDWDGLTKLVLSSVEKMF
jgi:hypothetical protein